MMEEASKPSTPTRQAAVPARFAHQSCVVRQTVSNQRTVGVGVRPSRVTLEPLTAVGTASQSRRRGLPPLSLGPFEQESKMSIGDIFIWVRGFLLTLPWALYLVAMDLVLSIMLPFSVLFPNFVYDASSFVAFTNWNWIQCIFEVFNGAKITMSGDTLPEGESAIVISNHVSWTDFYMIQALAVRSGMLGRCRWFSKIELRWVPLLGWGIWAMGMPHGKQKLAEGQERIGSRFCGSGGEEMADL